MIRFATLFPRRLDAKFIATTTPSPMSKPRKRLGAASALDYEGMPSGCCGMAGSFGFESGKYDVSMKAGERVLSPRVRPLTAIASSLRMASAVASRSS